jgi:hypothetical protein
VWTAAAAATAAAVAVEIKQRQVTRKQQMKEEAQESKRCYQH